MFDARLRPLINRPLDAMGRALAGRGVRADAVTLAGLCLAVAAGVAIAQGAFLLGLALVVANRILDGLDGAVARATGPTDFGGYLDIVADFIFYVAIPVGFALAAPANQLPALLLVSCFALTGVSFLAFATLAAKRGIETTRQGAKSFFYVAGLTEGAETIAAFVLMLLFPAAFGLIALVFSALCLVTVVQRAIAAWAQFR